MGYRFKGVHNGRHDGLPVSRQFFNGIDGRKQCEAGLIVSLLEIGVLYNIALHARGRAANSETQAIKDRVHKF